MTEAATQVATQPVVENVPVVAKPRRQAVVVPVKPNQIIQAAQTVEQPRTDYVITQVQADKITDDQLDRHEAGELRLPPITDDDKTSVMKEYELLVAARGETPESRAQRAQDIAEKRKIAKKITPGDSWFKLLAAGPAGPADQAEEARLRSTLAERGFTEDTLREVQAAQEAVAQWDLEEQMRHNHTTQELITMARKYQCEQLAMELLKIKDVLLAPEGEKLVEKAGALVEAEQLYETVLSNTDTILDLNDKLAELMDQAKGGGDTYQTKAKGDRQAQEDRWEASGTEMERTELIRNKWSKLTPEQRIARSNQINTRANELVDDLNAIRTGRGEKPLTSVEVTQLRRNWGIIDVHETGAPDLFNMEPESAIESILISQAVVLDATEGLNEGWRLLDRHDPDDVTSVFEVANAKVRGEALSVMAHSMVAETLNQQQAEEAILAARKLGMVDEAGRLEQMVAGSKDILKKCGHFIKDSAGAIWKWLKHVNWKEFGKYVLIGIGAVALLALVAALMAASVVTSALGAGGRG